MKYQTHKRQVSSMNLRQGGREKTPAENGKRSELSVHSDSIHFEGRKSKKARYEYLAFYTIHFFASRFFSADIDGDDPLCYDLGSRKGKQRDLACEIL